MFLLMKILVRDFFATEIDYQFIYFFKSLVIRDNPDQCK